MKLLFLAFNPNSLRGLCDVTSNNLTLKGQPTNAVQGCEMADANSDLKGFTNVIVIGQPKNVTCTSTT